MKKITTLLMIFILNSLALSQITVENQKTFGGSGYDSLFDSDTLLNGTIILCGSSSSGVSGNKTTPNYGLDDGWIISLNPDLSVNWEINIGGTDTDVLNAIFPTADGGFLCGGTSNSPISGNKTAPNIGSNDFWLLKIDVNGVVLWEKTYGGSDSDDLNSIVKLNDGDFILSGSSTSNISGTKSENSRGFSDYWVLRINSVGNIIWDKTIGGSGIDIQLGGSLVSTNNNVYISGFSKSNISSEKTENSYGLHDIWVIRLTENGNIIWDKTIGGVNSDYPKSMIQNDNDFFIVSYSNSIASGTKSSPNIGGYDVWVNRIDENGNILWDKTYGGTLDDVGTSILKWSDNSLLIGGSTSSTESQDVVGVNNGNSDFWFFRILNNGDFIEQKNIGGDQYDGINKMVKLANGELLLFGVSESDISGDKNEANFGSLDFWIIEVSSFLTVGNNELINQTKLFPNPNNGQFSLFGDLSSSVVTIFNIHGQVIEVFNLNSENINISLLDKGLKSGMYFMTIQKNNSIEKIKFILE